jgi:hypothetical protein
LFPWQELVADVAGEYHLETKIPVYRTVGVSVSRQNGKTTIVCARIARQLIAPRQTVGYTAQDRGLARTKWDEHVSILMDTPFAERVERVDRTNHREMLVSIDLAVVDEAHAHETMGVVSAIQPAMAARPHAQIWLLSNAGDSRSVLWRHYTDVGRIEVDNPASTMAWFEWSPSDPDADDVQFNRAAWQEGNPSLGLPGGVLETALSDGALTMDRPTFLREHLNVWADSSALVGIDAVVWAASRIDDQVPTEKLAFGLDFTPERDRGALAVAGQVGDGPEAITPIELVESSSDLERIVQRAAQVANDWNGLIIIDRGSPAASAVPALERLTWDEATLTHRVRLIPMTELVRACGEFHDAALHARISHRGDYRLTDAVVAATKRRVGEAWCWQRRGHADISPLVAATLGRWGVLTAPEVLAPAVW